MKRFLHALYCDDIREEKTNKLTLVGVYSADLYVSEFPAVLPKLAIFVTLATPVEEPFRQLEIKLKLDDEVIANISTSQEELKKGIGAIAEVAASPSAPEPNDVTGSKRFTELRSILVLSPFTIVKECILRVIATTESGDLRCPALRISLTPSVAAPSNVGNAVENALARQ